MTIGLVSGDLAVLGAGDFHFGIAGGPIAGCRDLLGAIEHQLDRGAGFLGELGGGDSLDVGAEFTPKSAAHEMGDAFDLVRNFEMLTQRLGRVHRRLSRTPTRPAAYPVP